MPPDHPTAWTRPRARSDGDRRRRRAGEEHHGHAQEVGRAWVTQATATQRVARRGPRRRVASAACWPVRRWPHAGWRPWAPGWPPSPLRVLREGCRSGPGRRPARLPRPPAHRLVVPRLRHDPRLASPAHWHYPWCARVELLFLPVVVLLGGWLWLSWLWPTDPGRRPGRSAPGARVGMGRSRGARRGIWRAQEPSDGAVRRAGALTGQASAAHRSREALVSARSSGVLAELGGHEVGDADAGQRGDRSPGPQPRRRRRRGPPDLDALPVHHRPVGRELSVDGEHRRRRSRRRCAERPRTPGRAAITRGAEAGRRLQRHHEGWAR